MTKSKPNVQPYTGCRVRHETAHSYDEVLTAVRAAVGDATKGELGAAARECTTQQAFEQRKLWIESLQSLSNALCKCHEGGDGNGCEQCQVATRGNTRDADGSWGERQQAYRRSTDTAPRRLFHAVHQNQEFPLAHVRSAF